MNRLLLVLTCCLFLPACGSGSGSPPPPACSPSPGARPNFVVLLTDDQERALADRMTTMQALIGDAGMEFEQAFVTTPLCCPSRASILTGRYAHNHGVLSNTLERGSHSGFRDSGSEANTLGTRLRAAGYTTAYIGKYVNGYPGDQWPQSAPVAVPPGWNEWFAPVDTFPATIPYSQFNYVMIDNGTPRNFGTAAADYFGDVVTARATEFIGRNCGPFFALVGYVSPHHPGTPAPRHASFEVTLPARSPSFNEVDVSDKPRWLQANPLLSDATIAEYDALQKNRIRSLLAVDESIAAIVDTLSTRGLLDNTYLVFTSDNGLRLGEHRVPFGKDAPYEEDLGVPMFWRGPGIPAGSTTSALALNVDIAPTILELAGISVTPEEIDGRSLVPLFSNTAAPWRRDFMFEHFSNVEGNIPRSGANPYGLEYAGLRDANSTYVEYAYGTSDDAREFYDLIADPFQLDNRYALLDAPVRAELAARLAARRSCVGDSCR